MSMMKELVKDEIRLPSPPAIAIRILEAVKKDDKNYDELARIISSDPSLAAKTLKVVNSSLYTISQKVDSLEKALAILGLNAMKNIALSFVISNELRSHTEGDFDFDFFWKRSVTAAVAADLTANLINNKNDDTFVTGLLQDIGIAVMYFSKKDDYLKVLNEKKIEESSVEAAEKIIFGFDHQELGSEILKEWGLSKNIYMPIRYHHNNVASPSEYKLRVNTVYLSDKISSVYHGLNSSDKITAIYTILGNKYEKSEREIENLIDLVAKRSIEILSVFEIDPANMKTYSQILQEANEELGKLNLSNENLLIKYKEAKNQAETLASQLKTANEKLRTMAFQDGLTGLYNYRYFQENLDRELSRSMRCRRPFSLIMFDLDHFKKINDSYGHRIGDIALQEISTLVLNSTRTNDIVARYGGEEFAIIAPETDFKSAAVFAERIKRSVEQMEILADSVIVKATISIGVATYLPGKEATTKTELLDAVDAALYASKNSGRNRLTMVKIGEEK
jgi:diguanylate cyclase (GGDEF)-like protein